MGFLFKKFVSKKDFDSFANKKNVEFKHAWFIISLFHDLGYKYENNNKYSCFDDYINCLNLEYNLLFNSKYEFNKEMVYNYLNYRKKFDHGITAGLLLFDRLKKNYNAMSGKYNKENLQEFIIPNTNIRFSEKDKDHYFLYAKCIIDHNIWYAYKKPNTDEDEWKSTMRKYKDNGLECLIIKKQKSKNQL